MTVAARCPVCDGQMPDRDRSRGDRKARVLHREHRRPRPCLTTGTQRCMTRLDSEVSSAAGDGAYELKALRTASQTHPDLQRRSQRRALRHACGTRGRFALHRPRIAARDVPCR